MANITLKGRVLGGFIVFFMLLLCSIAVSAAYDYKIPINCSNTDTGTPIIINGTNGFNIGSGQQIVWTNCQPEASGIALHYDSANPIDYIVKNDTANLAFEVETGNATSHNPTDVWDNEYTLVVHFNNLTAGDFMGSSKSGYNLTHTAYTNFTKEAGIIGDSINMMSAANNVCFKCVPAGCYHYPSNAIGYTFETWLKPSADLYNGIYLWDDQPGVIIKGVSGNHLSTWIYSSGAWFQADSNMIVGISTPSKITSTITNNYVTTIINTTAFYSGGSMGSDINFDDDYGGVSVFGNIVCDPHNLQPPGYADELRFSNKTRGSKYTNDTYFNVMGKAGYGVLGVKAAYCVPDWSCSAYGNCSISNTTACLNVSDSNLCGETFDGDLGDYNGTCVYVSPCSPSWSCSAYGNCSISNTTACLNVSDLNICNETFMGNLSDYGDSCIYCLSNWSCINFGDCHSNNVTNCLGVGDLNLCGVAFGGNLSVYNTNCSYIPPVFTTIGDNLILIGILLFFWLGLVVTSFIFKNFALGSFMWLVGLVLGFLTISTSFVLGMSFVLFSTLIFMGSVTKFK